jgi:uncharacterized membrane protein
MILMDILARVFVAIFALAGFFVALHIYKEKRKKKPLICPMRFDCNTVVNSDYSKFFGISVELLGMYYYLAILFSYIIIAFLPSILPVMFLIIISFISISAFLFSFYLIAVQVFILKTYCSWCLISAFISTCIFILTLYAYDFSGLFGLLLI